MSTYSLSGSGVQALTADTTALHVTITTLSPFGGVGHANPANHYHQALLRPGDGTGFWAPIPVEGGPQWIGLPNGTDRIGYSCEGGSVISVTEVIGGISPFAGPPGSTGPAGPAGPSGAASTLISTQTLSGTAASVTLGSIAGTYTHLHLLVAAKCDVGSDPNMLMRFNSDSGANYTWSKLVGGSSSGSTPASGQTSAAVGDVKGTGDASNPAVADILIFDYARTTYYKCYQSLSHIGDATNTYIVYWGGGWRSTAVITAVTLLPASNNFAIGSRFDLYGVS